MTSFPREELIAARKTLQGGLNTLTSKTNPHALSEDYKRVVVLGIDGLGAFDADEAVSHPNLDRIRTGSDVLYTPHRNIGFPLNQRTKLVGDASRCKSSAPRQYQRKH